MKTFKSLAIVVLAVVLTTSSFAGSAIDTSKSSVKWLAKKVTGEHYGTIGIKESNLVLKDGNVTSGKVVIDMNSIVCTDITDSESNAKLVGHIKSDDFFAVNSFPRSELVITSVESNGNTHSFSGNLTIKGITNPVSFKAISSKEGNSTVYKGTLTVDRSKFNVRYGSKSFFDNLGDRVIYDEFTLDFNLVINS
jgi:polyisoprenoid-binding protein YceI